MNDVTFTCRYSPNKHCTGMDIIISRGVQITVVNDNYYLVPITTYHITVTNVTVLI